MTNSSFLRSIISNPNIFTPNFLLKPSQNLITRPFTSLDSKPDPPTQSDPKSILDPSNQKPINPNSVRRKQLVEDLFKAKTEGLFGSAGKVFEKMSRRVRMLTDPPRLAQEAAERSRGHVRVPDELAHIAVIETYANAGQFSVKDQRLYLRMLGAGTIPNEHTYNLLIKLLALTSGGDYVKIGQAQKYMIEMLEKGIMPDPATSVEVFKALAKEGRIREGKEFLEDVKRRGFVVDDRVFKQIVKEGGSIKVLKVKNRVVVKGREGALKSLKGKNGELVRSLLEIFFAKKI